MKSHFYCDRPSVVTPTKINLNPVSAISFQQTVLVCEPCIGMVCWTEVQRANFSHFSEVNHENLADKDFSSCRKNWLHILMNSYFKKREDI